MVLVHRRSVESCSCAMDSVLPAIELDTKILMAKLKCYPAQWRNDSKIVSCLRVAGVYI